MPIGRSIIKYYINRNSNKVLKKIQLPLGDTNKNLEQFKESDKNM